MKLFGTKMKNIFPKMEDQSVLPETRLKIFIEEFSSTLITYPGFLRTQVRHLAEGKTLPQKAAENMLWGKKCLCRLISEITSEEKQPVVDKLAFQLISGFILPVLYGDFVESIYNIDITNKNERSKMIEIAINKLLTYGGEQ